MKFHHTGLLVDNIEDSINTFKNLYPQGKYFEKIYISSQKVYVCFFEISENTFVEFVESQDNSSIVSKLRKKGITYYHLGFKVHNIDESISFLEMKNFKLINTFYSEAFDNKKCAFLYTPEGSLLELIEMQ